MLKLLMIAGLVLGTATLAHAGEWNINATSCIADAGSIQNNLYLGTGGTVKHQSGKTGDIVLYCPVPPLSFTPAVVGITYYDDTASGLNHITAQLMQLDYSTGTLHTITGKADSLNMAAHTYVQATSSGFTGLTWNPAASAYYVRVDISRDTTVPVPVEIAYVIALST